MARVRAGFSLMNNLGSNGASLVRQSVFNETRYSTQKSSGFFKELAKDIVTGLGENYVESKLKGVAGELADGSGISNAVSKTFEHESNIVNDAKKAWSEASSKMSDYVSDRFNQENITNFAQKVLEAGSKFANDETQNYTNRHF